MASLMDMNELDNNYSEKEFDIKSFMGGAKKDESDDEDDDFEENKNSDDEEEDDDIEDEDDDIEDEDIDIGENTNEKKSEKIKDTQKNNFENFISDDEDMNSDDEDEDDDKYLQKFNENIKKNILSEYHPELHNHNYEEVEALCRVVRDENGMIIDPLHRTLPILTKYEKARILGERAKQIGSGAIPLVKMGEKVIDPYVIASKELEMKRIPFIIKRPLPNGGCEYWKLSDLEFL